MMVEAFICQVAGHGGSEHTVVDAPPSFPQIRPELSALATAASNKAAAHSGAMQLDAVHR